MLVVWQNIMQTMTSLLLRCVADGIMEFAGGQSLILTHSAWDPSHPTVSTPVLRPQGFYKKVVILHHEKGIFQ